MRDGQRTSEPPSTGAWPNGLKHDRAIYAAKITLRNRLALLIGTDVRRHPHDLAWLRRRYIMSRPSSRAASVRSPPGLGRVKTAGRAEHIERRSSSAAMSRAMASPLENRGAGRTRFPSVNVLSAARVMGGHQIRAFGASLVPHIAVVKVHDRRPSGWSRETATRTPVGSAELELCGRS
jgi:hypothetical protein